MHHQLYVYLAMFEYIHFHPINQIQIDLLNLLIQSYHTSLKISLQYLYSLKAQLYKCYKQLSHQF